MIKITRYHDISMGHRVYGHESKCAHLHGHNYRFHFEVKPRAGLDSLGRVIDFGVIKNILCEWLEREWDHKMMLWAEDPLRDLFFHKSNSPDDQYNQENIFAYSQGGFVIVPFNPTAENIAMYFVETVAPMLLANTDVYLYSLTIDETAKCSAVYIIDSVAEEMQRLQKRQEQPANMPSMYYCSRAQACLPCLCNGKSEEMIRKCEHIREDLPF